MSNSTSNNGGIGFCGLLTVVFVTLKLVDKIDWSWWLVLSPLWIPITTVLIICGSLLLTAAIIEAFDK
jgi:hypothetical protein